jgi:hypothetical protein
MYKRRHILQLGLLVGSGAILAACSRGGPGAVEVAEGTPTASSAPPTSPTAAAIAAGPTLVLLHTNDVMGYVDPCG